MPSFPQHTKAGKARSRGAVEKNAKAVWQRFGIRDGVRGIGCAQYKLAGNTRKRSRSRTDEKQ
jgi:hypothetical protein